jgi:hypothetical protein
MGGTGDDQARKYGQRFLKPRRYGPERDEFGDILRKLYLGYNHLRHPVKISAAVLWPGAIEAFSGGVEVVAWTTGGVFSGGVPEFSGLEDVGAAVVAGGAFVLEPSIRAFQSRSSSETGPDLGENPVLYRHPEAVSLGITCFLPEILAAIWRPGAELLMKGAPLRPGTVGLLAAHKAIEPATAVAGLAKSRGHSSSRSRRRRPPT